MFADDTKIFREITCKEDAVELQSDIDSLDKWSKKWLLSFNLTKCHVLTIGKVFNIQCTQRYKLSNQELEHVFEEKDLGVIIDADLKFEEHISSKVNKANALVGLIRRTFSFLDATLFKKLYVSFVRPHLEYAQVVWSPYLKKYKNMLENVQIRATKLVDGMASIPYHERLKALKLPTLAYRRARGDMIEIFKHIHIYDKKSLSPRYLLNTRPSRKHRYQLATRVPNDSVNGRQTNSFFFRSAKIWNELPNYVVDTENINSFKNHLDTAWSNITIKYSIPSDS